jgi:hypothetical protein
MSSFAVHPLGDRYLGARKLKNIAEPVGVFNIDWVMGALIPGYARAAERRVLLARRRRLAREIDHHAVVDSGPACIARPLPRRLARYSPVEMCCVGEE